MCNSCTLPSRESSLALSLSLSSQSPLSLLSFSFSLSSHSPSSFSLSIFHFCSRVEIWSCPLLCLFWWLKEGATFFFLVLSTRLSSAFIETPISLITPSHEAFLSLGSSVKGNVPQAWLCLPTLSSSAFFFCLNQVVVVLLAIHAPFWPVWKFYMCMCARRYPWLCVCIVP